MPCICGEITCICFYVCTCPPSCFCQACLVFRGPRQQTIIKNLIKQNHSPKKSLSRKKSAQRYQPNKQTSSVTNDSPPRHSQMNRSSSVNDQRKQTPCSTRAIKRPISSNDDPHATLKKQLNQPAPLLNYDPHPILRRQLSEPVPPPNNDPRATIRRQLSQPAPPSIDDQYPTLIRQLSEPCMIPMSGNLFSELPSSISNKNLSSIGGSSLSSLPSTSKTPSTSGFNKDLKSSYSTKSRSKNIRITPFDANNSCSSIEYIKKASNKALPSYESFSLRFATSSNDENNNGNLWINSSNSQNHDTKQTSTDLSSHSAEIHTPLLFETSGESSALSCNNPQFPHSPNLVSLQETPQEHPLNLSLSTEDKQKISLSQQSLEFSSQSPNPVPAKQKRSNSMEFSAIPTNECDNQRRASFSGWLSDTFSTRHASLSSDFSAQGSYPETRSESTASTSGSLHMSCIVQNPSQYTVNTEQYESPMETEASSKNCNQNISNYPLSASSDSSYFPCISQASTSNVIVYSNDLNDGKNFTLRTTSSQHDLQENQYSQFVSEDLNRFSETSENPYLEHEVFSSSNEQTSSTTRDSVIRYSFSRLTSQSTTAFSTNLTTNPINIPYQDQSHEASSSTFSPSLNLSDVGFLSSGNSETHIIPQALSQPLSSDVHVVPPFSIPAPTESMETYPGNQDHLQHQPESSTMQSASSGIPPARKPSNNENRDETAENRYSNRNKRKLS